MSYDKPKVVQTHNFLMLGSDRDENGKLTAQAIEYLAKVMPDTVHRTAPHVPAGRNITITITVEGDLA